MASVPEVHIDGFIAAVLHTVGVGMSPLSARTLDCLGALTVL